MPRIRGKKRMLPGSVTISRSSGGSSDQEGKPVHLQLVDEVSGCIIAIASLSLGSFGEAITGLSHVECEIEYFGGENIGKKYVYKTVNISLPEGGLPHKKEECERVIKELLVPHEVDGWSGRPSDVTNFHNRNGDGTVRVHFERFEEIEDEETDV